MVRVSPPYNIHTTRKDKPAGYFTPGVGSYQPRADQTTAITGRASEVGKGHDGDKKVDARVARLRSTPTQKLASALSDSGTINMAEPTHDKGKSALLDKFADVRNAGGQSRLFMTRKRA